MDNVGKIKKNRISKNKKKSWKNIDITDVEEFLEDERLQERTGGLVAEKTDDQLFVVDKRNDVIEESPLATQNDTRRKRRREPKPLKCHANLEPDPKIKPARIQHNVKVKSLEKKHKNMVEKTKSGKLSYTQIKAQEQRKKARQERFSRRIAKRKLPVADYDLWAAEDPNKHEDEHYMVITKKRRVNLPKHYLDKPSERPAVEIPHPGASYNPAYDEHQELLQTAHNVEVKKVRQENRLFNSLDAKFPKMTWNTIEKNWLDEMSAGLVVEDDEKQTFTPEELDKISINPPVRREDVKPRKQRRDEKLKKEEEKLKEKEEEKKLRERDVLRLKSIRKEIVQEEKKKEEKAKKKAEKIQAAKTQTRKLGKLKYEDPNIELKLSDELEGSLRLLKPEGNLFEDRYKSLQRRNVIEPRAKAKKQKQYKPKYFEKKSHKNVPAVKL